MRSILKESRKPVTVKAIGEHPIVVRIEYTNGGVSAHADMGLNPQSEFNEMSRRLIANGLHEAVEILERQVESQRDALRLSAAQSN